MTDSEEYLLLAFEKLFLFEFFLRNIQLDADQKREYDKLKQLPDKIAEMAEHLQISECRSEVFLTHEDFIGLVLPYLQFGELPNFNGAKLNEAKMIIELCEHFKSNGNIKLKSDFYRFFDLLCENKIVDIIDWWANLRNSDTRKEDNLEGGFGYISRCTILNKKEKKIVVHQHPFIGPESIRYTKKKNNYSIYETIENTTNDNKPSGARSLTLSVLIEENADNFDSILEEFKQRFSLLQSEYNFDLKYSEDFWKRVLLGEKPSFEPISGKDTTVIVKEKRKENIIVTRNDSIDKNLIGLLCYDLHKSGKKLDDAATEVASIYSKIHRSEASVAHETIIKYYNDTRDHISKIQHTLAEL